MERYMTRAIGLFVLLLTLGCPQENDQTPSPTTRKANKVVYIENKSTSVGTLEFEFSQKNGFLVATPTRIPEGIEQLTCSILGESYNQCISGLAISDLKSGQHVMKVTYSLADKLHSREFYFEIEEGQIIDTLDSDQLETPFLISSTSSLPKNAPVTVSEGLELEFTFTAPDQCEPSLLCARGNNRWTRCSKPSARRIQLSPHELVKGYQVLHVKVVCNGEELESNTIEYGFYGVTENYTRLGLKRVNQGKFALFLLERDVDCFGEVSFECNTSSTNKFSACSNLQPQKNSLDSIRAVCTSTESTSTSGPEFKVNI